MTIRNQQIERIEALIEKSYTIQGEALEGKKRYLTEIQDVIYTICVENKEDVPVWVYLLQTAPVKIGSNGIGVDVASFINSQIVYCQGLLDELRSKYYRRKNLFVSFEQKEEMKKQTILSKKSFCISKWAIAVSVISALVSIFAAFQNTRSNKISLDETQYNAIYQILSKDSVASK